MTVNSCSAYSLRAAGGVALLFWLLAAGPAASADVLEPIKDLFKDDEGIVVWTDGPDQYVKVAEQDRFKKYERPSRNKHPAKLNPADLAIVLASIKNKNSVTLFTAQKVALLAAQITEALSRARDREDVTFAVADDYKTAKGAQHLLVAGRLFVNEDGLNIIFGPLFRPLPGGDFKPGRRMEQKFPEAIIANSPGISYWGDKRYPRQDWVIVNMPAMLAAYKGPKPVLVAPEQKPQPQSETAGPVAAELIQHEELARERRQATTAGADAAAACSRQYQQRLAVMQDLYDRKLLSDEEYAAKRKEILSEI